MSERRGLIAAGNWVVDHVKIIDVWPEQDALANILEQSSGNGGCAYSLLVDLARLGAPFPLHGVGLIGNDAEGDRILSHCSSLGIDTSGLLRHERAPTSFTDVMTVKPTARRTFFHQRGANALLGPEHIQLQGRTEGHFHLGYLLLLDRLDQPDLDYGTAAARVLAEAKKAGLRTSVDVVSEDSRRFADIVLPALPHVDLCLMNEFEAERCTSVPVRSHGAVTERGLAEACQVLLDHGVQEWAIIHFPEGAFALSRSGERLFQGSVKIPASLLVGAVGAGDAFAAGVLYGSHEDAPMQECLRFGACAAAASLTHASASEGLMILSDCCALGDRYGFRHELPSA